MYMGSKKGRSVHLACNRHFNFGQLGKKNCFPLRIVEISCNKNLHNFADKEKSILLRKI